MRLLFAVVPSVSSRTGDYRAARALSDMIATGSKGI
jgi:hypothetical protein